jgi:hypothetical protein
MQTLFELNQKNTTKSYGGFTQLMKKAGEPEKPVPSPSIEDFLGKFP